MKLGKWERLILANVLADITRLSATPEQWMPGMDRMASAIAWTLCKNARKGIVPIDLRRWLGHSPSAADQTQGSRAVRSLMDRGLAIGYADINVKELSLTSDGETAARGIATEIQHITN